MRKYVTLGDVCKKGSSNIAQKDIENSNGTYAIYGASGYIKDVNFYHQDKPYIAVVKDGAGIGRTMLLPEKTSVIGTLQYLIPNDSISVKYLYYAVTYMNLSKYFTGATIPHIYFKDYQKELLPLPPMEKQLEIARNLEKIDAMIGLCNSIVEKMDVLVKSRFIEMFGDPVKNQHGYPLVSLSEYIDFLTSGSRGWAKYCVDDGDEWFITIKNVKNCRITTENMQSVHAPKNAEAQRTRVQEGDLLISITADLGRTGVVSKEIANHGAYINQHLSCIRLKKGKLLPLYVAYFMESPAGKMQFFTKNQSAVKAGLNFDSIKSLRLLAPPIKLQENFVSFIDEIEKSKLVCSHIVLYIEILLRKERIL